MLLLGMTQLPILAVAFGIYIFGIAIILFLRPTAMFQPGGSWKEFGIGRGDNHTIIPFWLFAIFWAFISYGVALVVLSQFANIANQSVNPGLLPQPQIYQGQAQAVPSIPQQQQFMQQVAPAAVAQPISSMIGLQQNIPGFYVLSGTGSGTQPQYVYYGTAPPPVSR
jgi:hypothetical protein